MIRKFIAGLFFAILTLSAAHAQFQGSIGTPGFGDGGSGGAILPAPVPGVVAVQNLVSVNTFNEDFSTNSPIPNAAYPNWKTNFSFCDQSNTLAGLQSRSYPNPISVMLDDTFIAATGGDLVGSPVASGGHANIIAAPMDATNIALYGATNICNPGPPTTRTYSSVILNTQNHFSQSFGYFEMQGTLPHQANDSTPCSTTAVLPVPCSNGTPGTWPAFWMTPQSGGINTEIDAFEEWSGQWILSSVNASPIQSLTWSGGVVTATTATPHGAGSTFKLTVAGTTPAGYAVQGVTATTTGANTFTYPLVSNPGANTVPGNYADISLVSQTWAAGTVTVTTDAPLNKTIASQFNFPIVGASPSGYNTTPNVGILATVTGTNTFTYTLASDPGTNTVPGTYGQGVLQDRVGCPKSTLHYSISNVLQTPISNNTGSAGCTDFAGGRLDLTVPHIFGVLWAPTEIDYYIDQVFMEQITSAATCTGSPRICRANNATALSHVNDYGPLYLIVSMDVANYSSGAGDPAGGVYPATYSIDYVRAWALKP